MGSPERHLAIFIRSLGGGGGAERAMVNLAAGIAERGVRVDLVLGRTEGNFFDEVPDTVRVVDLKGRTPLPCLPALLRDRAEARVLAPALLNLSPPWVLGRAPALARYLREERPDAVLSALNYTNVTALWARALAGSKVRLVICEQNTLSVRAASESKRRLRVLPDVVRHFYPWADAIVAVSRGVADDLAGILGLPGEAIHAIPNPLITPELRVAAREPLDDPNFAEGAPPVVLGVGKLKTQKDFPTLLRAFAELRRERPLRLVILGEGPERPRLEALARELDIAGDVALPGFVDNPFAYMARARVFALSSAWEGLPSVLIQAMACGCPVVSTDCPSGPAEILEGGSLGPLVPVSDAPALARAIRGALDRAPSAEALRSRADSFSVDRAVSRYLDVLFPAADAACTTNPAPRSATTVSRPAHA